MEVKRLFIFLAAFLVLWESVSFSTSLWERLAKRELSSPPEGAVPIVPRKIAAVEKDYQVEYERMVKEAESYVIHEDDVPKGSVYAASLDELYFLPFKDHYFGWMKLGVRPRLFVILHGKVGLSDLERASAVERLPLSSLSLRVRKALAGRGIRKAYLLKAPIFVGETGCLSIKREALFLSVKTAPVILVNGKLRVVESVVAAFDPERRDFASRRPISYREADLYGVQEPRPYVLAFSGGTLVVYRSYIRGLGYRNLMGGFGIGCKNWLYFGLRSSPFLLLVHPELPTAIFYENRVEDCFMGFYGYNLRKGLVLKNHFVRNWKYGVNIHDWSRVYIAGNTVERTRLAHGIILSRYCLGTVYGNLSVKNAGAGVMLDRLSSARIAGNLLWRNDSGGISLLESGKTGNIVVERNLIAHNYPYGLFVRNSSGVLVRKNAFVHNLGPGAKVITADISSQLYRNLFLDPYREVAWAWFEDNTFKENLDSDLKTMRGGAVGLENNRFFPQMLILDGEARRYNHLILKEPLVIIKGYGNPKWHQSASFLEESYRYTFSVISYFLKEGHPEARTAKGLMMSFPLTITSDIPRKLIKEKFKPKCARKWLLSAALRGDPDAMVILGGLELRYSLAPKDVALKWLVLGALYGGRDGFLMLEWAPRWWNIPEGRSFEAFRDVLSEVDCARISLPPWPELLGGCSPDSKWADRLISRLRKVLYESGFCAGGSYEKVWNYLRREGLSKARADLEKHLRETRLLIREKNLRRLAYYEKLEHMSKELREALSEGDPVVLRMVSKEREKLKWQRFQFERILSEDWGLVCGFAKKMATSPPEGEKICVK